MPQVLLATTLAALFFGCPFLSIAQDGCQSQSVVSEVTLPAASQLAPNIQAAIRARLIGRCSDDALIDRVRDALQNFGYFRATVSEPQMTILDFSRNPRPVSVNLQFTEGVQYKVREITWSGIKAVSGDQIFSISSIRPEDILDTSKVRDVLETVRRLYGTIGYRDVAIVPEVRVHGHWASLYFRVLEGAQSP
jgi:Surface antigen variable number repeat